MRCTCETRGSGGVGTYIRTLPSSPAEANIHGFAGFHATELQQPFSWPSSFSMRAPLSLCQMYTAPPICKLASD
jgi:hypothetical protein